MLKAYSFQTKALIQFSNKEIIYRLERRDGCGTDWHVLTDTGFVPISKGVTPKPVSDIYLDEYPMDGICQYRARDITNDNDPWDYTVWLRRGTVDPIGYTYGNYKAPEGSWGEIITTDDMRTFLWGVDFRASNGASFTDAQIQFFIDDALALVERELNITIKKTRCVCEPERRGLKKGEDYDVTEGYYKFKRERVERTGMIHTRKRPIVSVSRCDLLSRNEKIMPLLQSSIIDHVKGRIEFYNRPYRTSDTARAVETAIYPYGADTLERNLLYAIDYVAGFESSDDVPADLRQIIGKIAACSLLNIIGRGLMSGFSSSSLSMDGVSESFSSTQSATSAYYGADVKEYKDDIDKYLAENRLKFGHWVLGSL
jgi:hypothetical protein